MNFTMPFTRATRMRALTIGVIALGVLSLQVGRGTMAYFTTQVTSTGNAFSAGNLHFNIADNNEGPNLTTVGSSLSLTNMKPGDSVFAPITITNIGSLDGQFGIKYSSSFNADATGTGLGTDLTPHLQLAIVGQGGGTGVLASCTRLNAKFTDVTIWKEQIKPTLTLMTVPVVTTPVTQVPIVNYASTHAPAGGDGTYDPVADAVTVPAFLPLNHAGATSFSSDKLCVQVTFPDNGDPGLAPGFLTAGDNSLNTTNAQSLNTTIVFTFDGQQRNMLTQVDQTTGPTPPNTHY